MASQDEKLKFLSHVAILENLTDQELVELQHIIHKKDFRENSVIMREGDSGDEMYLFQKGEVRVSKNLTLKIGKRGGFSKAEKSMVTLKAENVDFFGEMAAIENEKRSATITANTDCVLYLVKRKDFEKLCFRNPAIGYKILLKVAKVLSKRIRDGNTDILKLTTALSIAISR